MVKETKPKRGLKSSESMRQKAEKASAIKQPRRLRRTAGTVARPFKAARRVSKKEVYLPMPDNRIGRFMNKRRHVIPRYFRNSWAELRQVEWPDRRTTAKLTLAVFMFALIFGTMITLADYGLDKLFRKVLLK